MAASDTKGRGRQLAGHPRQSLNIGDELTKSGLDVHIAFLLVWLEHAGGLPHSPPCTTRPGGPVSVASRELRRRWKCDAEAPQTEASRRDYLGSRSDCFGAAPRPDPTLVAHPVAAIRKVAVHSDSRRDAKVVAFGAEQTREESDGEVRSRAFDDCIKLESLLGLRIAVGQ